MIYVTGDTHGEIGRIYEFDRVLKKGDTVIVCGDWGYLWKNDFSERRFLEDIAARPWRMLFVDGNHENFPALYAYPMEEWNGGYVHRVRKNILHLCRGQVFTIEGKRFFTFGGGNSIDKSMRTPGRSWWPEEMPTAEEYAEGRKNLARVDDCVDYIITHTVPMGALQFLGKHHGAEEAPLNNYLEEIAQTVWYQKWFAGHMHMDKKTHRALHLLWFDMHEL